MKRPGERAVLLGLGVVALAAFLIVAITKTGGGEKDSGESQTSAPVRAQTDGKQSPAPKKPKAASIPTIVVRAGEPVGGVADLNYAQGERVLFKVTSDVADEIHLHGYDISKEVEAGGTATFDFPAEIEGIFEVELEERAVQIAELQVNP